MLPWHKVVKMKFHFSLWRTWFTIVCSKKKLIVIVFAQSLLCWIKRLFEKRQEELINKIMFSVAAIVLTCILVINIDIWCPSKEIAYSYQNKYHLVIIDLMAGVLLDCCSSLFYIATHEARPFSYQWLHCVVLFFSYSLNTWSKAYRKSWKTAGS